MALVTMPLAFLRAGAGAAYGSFWGLMPAVGEQTKRLHPQLLMSLKTCSAGDRCWRVVPRSVPTWLLPGSMASLQNEHAVIVPVFNICSVGAFWTDTLCDHLLRPGICHLCVCIPHGNTGDMLRHALLYCLILQHPTRNALVGTPV